MEGQKEKLNDVFDLLKLWFRDIMLIKNGAQESLLFNADQLELLKKESYRVSLKQSVEILERIEQARAQLSSHVNVGLILETLIMDIRRVRKQGYSVSIGETIVGSIGMSAPIMNYIYPAALSIFGPADRLKSRVDNLKEELKESANRISSKITGGA